MSDTRGDAPRKPGPPDPTPHKPSPTTVAPSKLPGDYRPDPERWLLPVPEPVHSPGKRKRKGKGAAAATESTAADAATASTAATDATAGATESAAAALPATDSFAGQPAASGPAAGRSGITVPALPAPGTAAPASSAGLPAISEAQAVRGRRLLREHPSVSVVSPSSPLKSGRGHISGLPEPGEEPAPLHLASMAPVAFAPTPAIHSAGSSHSKDHRPLRIAHLYPSLLNVAGDGGNLIAIQRRAQWRGIPVEVVAVEKGEKPDFTRFDIVLFHGGQDVEMKVAADDFAQKAPSLRKAVEEGVLIFAVCAGLQLLGHRYISNAGEVMKGAGILDLETRGGPQRFMQHAACEVTLNGATETVVGFENHSGLTELGPGCEAFGKVIAGGGNNGKDGQEGAKTGHVFATYLHGPVLPKNPWLTDQLIRIAVGRAEGVGPTRVALAPLDDSIERRAHQIALEKAMANRGRRTALEPARLVRGQTPG